MTSKCLITLSRGGSKDTLQMISNCDLIDIMKPDNVALGNERDVRRTIIMIASLIL